MLVWAGAFLVFALVAAFFGVSGMSPHVTGLAQVLFIVFLLLAVVLVLMAWLRRPR
jgi:uncharacterized membrane protein YtjA (UPF0391 family)